MQWAEANPPQAPTLYSAVLRYVVEATSRQLSSPYQINDWSAARAHDYLLTLYKCVPVTACLFTLPFPAI
jgi:hypothetical protein